jgi:hypothetical protein
MRGQTVTVEKRDSNSWTVTVQVFVNDDFNYLRGKTGFFSKHRTCRLMSCLSNALNFGMNRISITTDIVNNLSRGQTVTVQKRDSNSWTVTVHVFVNE